eukprot:TRINITY_DN661_c0_g1_i1.p1 TRINITY_DN661_c0_g1~~TRINITY_DN661_c0_g1_i1.p1  ORF type:complete len:141 (+),score=22.03 TRINITY_DN661_c0_g1_i1:167-589(+)
MSMMDTPKYTKVTQNVQMHTPEELVQVPWDPRSPMANRTPIPLDSPSVVPLETSASTPTVAYPMNPLDPRSPLVEGNRTPIPADELKNDKPKKQGGHKKNKNKDKKETRKMKVVTHTHTQDKKPIKRQIAFFDSTNVMEN